MLFALTRSNLLRQLISSSKLNIYTFDDEVVHYHFGVCNAAALMDNSTKGRNQR